MRAPFGGYNNDNFRGRGGGGFSFLPPVIKFLIISNAAIFLAQLLLSSFRFGDFSLGAWLETTFALWPLESGRFYPWQFVTYAFLHGGFFHLLFNMMMLFFFGMEVEQVLGQKRFISFYLLCAIGGGLAHWLISPAPVVGASGAIFGVMVAMAIIDPNRTLYIFPFPVPIQAKYFVGIYVLYNLFSGISGSGGAVAHFAHLGGAVVGLVYFLHAMGKFPFGGGSGRSRSRGPNNQDYWQAFQNPWEQQQKREEQSRQQGGFGNIFRRPNRDDETVDAEYYDVNDRRSNDKTPPSNSPATHKGRVITQEEIDRILDKIAEAGYSNLTEDERQILFEASKKMDERR